MQTARIRQRIAQAVEMENQTAGLTDAVRRLAQTRGARPDPQETKGVVQFIQKYVEQAPDLLDAAESASRDAGTANRTAPILQAAEFYFLSPEDVLPDRLGLLGLMDDAYLAQSLIQSVCDLYRQRTGRPMLPIDLTQQNRVMRALIGDPQAGMLDAAVQATLAQGAFQQNLGGLTGCANPFSGFQASPGWSRPEFSDKMIGDFASMGIGYNRSSGEIVPFW